MYKGCLYIRETLGKNKKPIKIYKLRTMKLEPVLTTTINLESAIGTSINKESLVPMGEFLRKYWIDEIPQIYNLINGDISIMGVRPKEKRILLEEKNDLYFNFKPGLIGICYGIPLQKTINSKNKKKSKLTDINN